MAKAKQVTEGELSEREKQRIALKEKMEKDYGKGSVMGGRDKGMAVEVISTGSIGLDLALGVWGLPKGRIVEIYGPESSGKTTLCGELIAQAHKDPNSLCAIIDAEHALDGAYFASLGVDLDRVDISQPDYGEQALNIARDMIKSGLYDVIMIDSVAALTPKTEMDGEIGDSKISPQARMMGQTMRVMIADIHKSNTIVVFTNQLREKVGVVFGTPEITPGGNALKFYASIRLDIRKVTTNKEEDVAVSNKVRVKVIKNKVAPPFRQAEFNIEFGEGISKFQETIDIGVELDIIKKSGSWFSYNEMKIGQGMESVKALLADNEDLFNEIRTKVMNKLKGIEPPIAVTEQNTEE